MEELTDILYPCIRGACYGGYVIPYTVTPLSSLYYIAYSGFLPAWIDNGDFETTTVIG